MDRLDLKDALKMAATSLAGLFAGNAMYINLVDHPARMNLKTPEMRIVWKEGFHRAKRIQGTMVLIGAAAATGAWYLEENADRRLPWLLGAGLFITVWPWTLLVMIPDINRNLDENVLKNRGEAWSRDHMIRWNKQHGFRTLVSLGAFGIFLYALARK
ncbi:uncharacterized protein LOC128238464 isoform X2 [Mya arenaria]|nr:uncharacterized protein LOC128238464 isoform X2 [Mya arenaria]XP_052810391.1 uncharacterized protein LOC128238464 isoform X2 [Mya arenaria]